MNGSGYMANHHLRWDANGSADFDGSITATSGEIAGFTINQYYLGNTYSSNSNGVHLGSGGTICAFNDGTAASGLAGEFIGDFRVEQYIAQTTGGIKARLPFIKLDGVNVTLGYSDLGYIYIDGQLVNPTNSNVRIRLGNTTPQYSYDGGSHWFDMGRRNTRIVGTSSSSPTAETLYNTDETFIVNGNIRMPDGQYDGQHITFVSKKSGCRVYGKINTTSTTYWYEINGQNEIHELYWNDTLGCWAAGFLNKIS
jgi:hypothetical protein